MTDLLIDLGNTRLKWALSAADSWRSDALVHRDRDIGESLNAAWKDLPAPERVVLVSVASDTSTRELELWIRERWRVAPQRVQAQREQLGVVNRYREPATLGADRWAALLGARALTPGACAIVNCGTAVTIDALSAEGVFAGGVIVPGLMLMRQSLGRGTAGIAQLEGDASSCLAQATGDAVAAGAVFGLAGAIDRILNEQRHALGTGVDVFMTGGDASLLAARVTHPVTEVPDLVLKGLARIAGG